MPLMATHSPTSSHILPQLVTKIDGSSSSLSYCAIIFSHKKHILEEKEREKRENEGRIGDISTKGILYMFCHDHDDEEEGE